MLCWWISTVWVIDVWQINTLFGINIPLQSQLVFSQNCHRKNGHISEKKTCGEHYNIEEWTKYEHREILPPNTPQNQQGPPPVVTVLMPNLARFRHPRLMGIHLASVQINSICSWGVKQWEWEKKKACTRGNRFIIHIRFERFFSFKEWFGSYRDVQIKLPWMLSYFPTPATSKIERAGKAKQTATAKNALRNTLNDQAAK